MGMGGTRLTIAGHGFNVPIDQNTITVGSSSASYKCVPRRMINHACARGDSAGTDCILDAVYGYKTAAERHYAKVFEFGKYDLLECDLQPISFGDPRMPTGGTTS